MKIGDRFIFIGAYGLFLGFVLSFVNSGIMFANFGNDPANKEIYFSILFIATISACLFAFFYDVKVTRYSLSALMIFDVILLLSFYYLVNIMIDESLIFLSYILTFMIGFINVFISNIFLLHSKKYNSYADIFVNIAIVMAIAKFSWHISSVLMAYDYINLPFILSFFIMIINVMITMKLDFKKAQAPAVESFIGAKDLYVLGAIIFLLKLSEGILYKIVINYILAFQNQYKILYVIPYLLIIALLLIISYKIKKRILALIFICIGIMGTGFTLILISSELIEFSGALLHFGITVLDILVWGIVIYLIYIYDNAHKIVNSIMLAQSMGMFVGYSVYEIKIFNIRPAYLIALIGLFVSALLVLKVKEISTEEMLSKIEIVLHEKYKSLSQNGQGILNDMEKKVLSLILDMKNDREISHKLNISILEVETYYSSICLKFGANTREEIRNKVEKEGYILTNDF